MSGGLVRGGSGEIPLRNVLLAYPHLQAVSLRRDTEPIARKYEAEHPGVVVVCPWEEIDNADIAEMREPERRRALADRAALAARREAATKVAAPVEKKVAGDPARFMDDLRRLRIDMKNLEVGHPQYVKLFTELASQINNLEDALIADGVKGVTRTEFTLATQKFPKAPVMSAERKAELQRRVEAYQALSMSKRKESIEAATDPELTRMLLGVETEQPIRDKIVLKLFTMEATAAAV